MHFKQEWGRRMAKKAFDRLDALVKGRGHGAITKLEKSLGYEEGWFKNHRKANHVMSLPNLLSALRELGERPEDFFEGLIEEEESNAPRKVPIVLQALSRASCLGSSNQYTDELLTDRLDQIDESRFNDPVGALAATTQQIEHCSSLEDLSKALAIAGSCYKASDRIEAAFECLDTARFIGNHNDSLVGDSLQRLTYCYNHVNPNKALRLAKEACLIYAKRMNLQKIGETQIDQANSYYALGNLTHSYQQLLAGLKYKSHLREISISAIYQGLALVSSHLERQDEAIGWLLLAEELAESSRNISFLAHVLWTKGKMFHNREALVKAYKLLQRTSAFDAIMCLFDLCELRIEKEQLKDILRSRIKENEEPFLSRMSENILSDLNLGRDLNTGNSRKRVQVWHARHVSTALARLERDTYPAKP